MKNLLLITLTFITFSLANAGVVSITHNQGGDAFDKAIASTFSPPADGSTVDGLSLAMADVFQQATVQGVAGTSVYKRGHGNPSNANSWALSSGPQYFYLTPDASYSAGGEWRTLKTAANGTSYAFGSWVPISSGENSIGITVGTAFLRQVGVQVRGVNGFTNFGHYQQTSHGISTLEVVPEPSTYALLAGLVAFVFVAIKRRK